MAEHPNSNPASERTISPLAIVNVFFRHRALIAGATAVGIAFGVTNTLLQVRSYQAQATFVISPAAARGVGGMGGDLGPVQQRDPFEYYTSVLASTDVRDAVLSTPRPSGGVIMDHLGLIDGGADRTAARDALAGADVALEASSRARTSGAFPVLLVRASWGDAQMAADLANAFVAALADYDRRIRSSSAKARGGFVETQIKETSTRLAAAEDTLRVFREQNRLLMGATRSSTSEPIPVPPQLELRREQLQREVTVQAELYLSLKRAFDQVRIAELDDASALVLVEPASPPRFPTGVARRTLVVTGALIGLLAGLGLAVLSELRQRADLSSPEAREFVGHLQTIRDQAAGAAGRLRGAAPSAHPVEHPATKHDA